MTLQGFGNCVHSKGRGHSRGNGGAIYRRLLKTYHSRKLDKRALRFVDYLVSSSTSLNIYTSKLMFVTRETIGRFSANVGFLMRKLAFPKVSIGIWPIRSPKRASNEHFWAWRNLGAGQESQDIRPPAPWLPNSLQAIIPDLYITLRTREHQFRAKHFKVFAGFYDGPPGLKLGG
jgi:hypothetical protein